MPDFFKACHLTLSSHFLPSVLSSYPFSIYSINSVGQGLPLSEGLKHSEVSPIDAPLDVEESFVKSNHFYNLTSVYSFNL